MTQFGMGSSVAFFALLAGCGGAGGASLNAPVEITVAFQSGATTPTTVKADTPTAWDGNLCLPSSLEFVGQNGGTGAGAGWHMFVRDNCSDASNPPFHACTPVGAPPAQAQDGTNVCATAPLQTPTSVLGSAFTMPNGGGLVGPFTNTAGVTSVVIFYCGSGDTLLGPPEAGDVIGCVKD